jgi:hypothetical protein
MGRLLPALGAKRARREARMRVHKPSPYAPGAHPSRKSRVRAPPGPGALSVGGYALAGHNTCPFSAAW